MANDAMTHLLPETGILAAWSADYILLFRKHLVSGHDVWWGGS